MSKFLLNYTDTYTDFDNKIISDFILYNCGVEYCDSGWSYGPKRREYNFIHFVKDGKGVLQIEGRKFHIHKNQCFIVPAGYVSTYTADKNDPWKYSWIGFLGIQSERYVKQLINKGFVLNIKDAKKYEKQIRKIINLPANSLASQLKMTGFTYDIFGSLIDEIDASEVTINDSVATLAKRYMDLNYYDAIKISEVAKFLNVNSNYLSDTFKEEYKISPKQYLIELKIKKARKLLSSTHNSIKIVANSVGFNDPLAFSKLFKSHTGYSPSDYRKENKKPATSI